MLLDSFVLAGSSLDDCSRLPHLCIIKYFD